MHQKKLYCKIEAMTSGEDAERRVAVKLPRMSFEISSINYDETRQLNKMNTISKVVDWKCSK